MLQFDTVKHYIYKYALAGMLGVVLTLGCCFSALMAEDGGQRNPLLQSEEKVLIHHWNFNDIPNDSNFAISEPQLLHVSSRRYGAMLTYDGARWDRVNDPTSLNAREVPYEITDDRALRLRNPAGSLIVSLPTRGFRDVVFRYAVTRTPNGAQLQQISYSTDGGESFSSEGLSQELYGVEAGEYKLVELDFSDIPEVDNNPGFQVKITMTGEGAESYNYDGNQRFNNLTLDGYPVPEEVERDLIHYWKFDNIPNDADFPTGRDIASGGITGGVSTVDGASLRYDGDRWDRVNAPTSFNARTEPYEAEDDRALRLRNPTGDFTLRLPTTGYKNVVFRYAVKRTGSGATAQQVAYSTDGTSFRTDGLAHDSVLVGENYVLHVLEFSDIDEVDDNPEFTIRITATGKGAEPDNYDGNQRYNHITVDAEPMETSAEYPQETGQLPDRIRLEQNYPNPFNPATNIRFSLPEPTHVTLEVFDITGQHVQTLVDQQKSAGNHTAFFHAGELAGGIYLYRLEAGGERFTRRMMFIK